MDDPGVDGTVLSGEQRFLDCDAGRVAYRVAGPDGGARRPLLLVHSVNAAASAFEVRPVYERQALMRPVYALDLPGFGDSERGPRPYSPRMMTDAVSALADRVVEAHGAPAHALALSLGCEFLTRSAVEGPGRYASLALVSPTGMNGAVPRRGAPGSDRGMPGFARFLGLPGVGAALFALLTTRASIGYFMRRTYGSRDVDPALVEVAHRVSHAPGACHAPFRFLSGYLFSGDAFSLYEALRPPVWIAHGVRGDFQDYRLAETLLAREGWSETVFDSGALPHFERASEFADAYEEFLGGG